MEIGTHEEKLRSRSTYSRSKNRRRRAVAKLEEVMLPVAPHLRPSAEQPQLND
jgi:hypothetical protein